MSDLLEEAAAALGIPEALAKRSAEARAAETGAEVDEILAAWAGGEAAAPAAAPSEEAAAPEAEEAATEPEEAEVEPEEEAEPAPAPAARPEVVVEVPEPEPVPSGVAPALAEAGRPPVLVGAPDNPVAVLAGVVGLFFVVVMVGLIGPALPSDPPGARTSEIQYSDPAIEGREVYASLGCAFCHTQMVRPVVADVGLGAVTLSDTNQVLGVRRFGPDLSDVGTRITASQIEAVVTGFGDHPPHLLAPEDVQSLVAYLAESKTSPEVEEEAPSEGGDGESATGENTSDATSEEDSDAAGEEGDG